MIKVITVAADSTMIKGLVIRQTTGIFKRENIWMIRKIGMIAVILNKIREMIKIPKPKNVPKLDKQNQGSRIIEQYNNMNKGLEKDKKKNHSKPNKPTKPNQTNQPN